MSDEEAFEKWNGNVERGRAARWQAWQAALAYERGKSGWQLNWPHPIYGESLPTNPKPLLTRKQVDAFTNKHCDCTDPRCKFEEAACRTIEQMAELLRRLVYLYGGDAYIPNALQDAKDMLQTFNATGGEGS